VGGKRGKGRGGGEHRLKRGRGGVVEEGNVEGGSGWMGGGE